MFFSYFEIIKYIAKNNEKNVQASDQAFFATNQTEWGHL